MRVILDRFNVIRTQSNFKVTYTSVWKYKTHFTAMHNAT